jgi:hypothetical protein
LTIGAFIFTIVLVVISLQLDVNRNTNENTPELNTWTELEKRSIHKLTLFNNDNKIKFLKNTTGVWIMSEPERIVADQARVHKVLTTILEMDIKRVLPLMDIHKKRIASNGLSVKCEFSDKTIICSLFKMPMMNKHLYIHFKGENRVLKCIEETNIDFQVKTSLYWTRRLFPFTIESIKTLVYTKNDHKVYFSQTKEGWTSSIIPGLDWQLFFSEIQNASCLEYIKGKASGDLLASYEFDFQSGRKSLLELRLLPKKGFVAFYMGTTRGQILNKETVDKYFPVIHSK